VIIDVIKGRITIPECCF